MYVCLCNAITDRDARFEAEREGSTVASIYRGLGKRPQCGKCAPLMRQLLRECTEPPQEGAD